MFRLSNFQLLFVLLISTRFIVGAEDQVLPYAPEEPVLVNRHYPRDLNEEDLRSFSLSDPELRIAYAFLVGVARSGPKIVDERTPEMVAALNDLKRRGDSATPLLLDIMEKNHNTSLEYMTPHLVARIGTIKMEPYLDYLREMITTRPDEINASANEVTAKLFLEHGTADDEKLLQELAKKRPFLAPSLERAYDFQRYKYPDRSKQTPTGATSAPLPIVQPPAPKPTPSTAPTAVPDEEAASSTPWGIIVVLIVAATGFLWLVLKKEIKGRGQ
jgi:hypothetical protein